MTVRNVCFTVAILLFSIYGLCHAQTTEANNQTSPTVAPPTSPTTSPSQQPVTTSQPDTDCTHFNGSCEDCIKQTNCYFCEATKSCRLYPYSHVLPLDDGCALSDARWLQCWLNFEAMLIGCSVVGGILLITLCCTVYCCCCKPCKNRNRKKLEQEEAKIDRQREERRVKYDERRKDREEKNNEIRRKYGLVKDDAGTGTSTGSSGYQRFQNED